MIVFTAAQLLEMSLDSVPEAFKGRLTKLYSLKKGTNKTDGSPWTMQTGQLTDGSKTIEVVFSNRPEIPRSAEGSEIYCVAARGDRGLSGLKRKENNYKNKITAQVWVYDGADVSFNGQSAPAGDAPAERQSPPPAPRAERHDSPASTPPPAAPTNGKPSEGDTLAAIKQYNIDLARECSALNRCFDAAAGLIEGVLKRHPNAGQPVFSDLKEIAVTLFIQSGWDDKAHSRTAFPVKEFSNYAKPNGATNGHAPAPNGTPGRTGTPDY